MAEPSAQSRGPQQALTLCSFHLHLCWLSGLAGTHCCEKPSAPSLHLRASSPIMEVMPGPPPPPPHTGLVVCFSLSFFSHFASLSSFSFAYFSSLVSHLHFFKKIFY